MSKNRIKKQLQIITTREEAEAFVRDVALITLNKIKATAKMDAEIAALRKNYEGNLAAYDIALADKTAALQSWAESNPKEFPMDRKSLDFVQGTIGFRTGTPKLALLNRSWDWDTVLVAVRTLLPAFLRSKPEIDKEALIAQRDEEIVKYGIKQCGMKIVQGESFFVEPKITEVEQRQVSQTS